MAQIITRLYAEAAHADGVVRELVKYGLPASDIQVTRPGGSAEATLASILKGHVRKGIAGIYAEGVAKGGTLVSAAAWGGHAYTVIQIMEEGTPIPSGYTPPSVEPRGFDEAAPFSDMLGIPVLSIDGKAGFSGFPLIAHGFSIPIPQLASPKPTFPIAALPNGPSIPVPQLTNDRGGYKPVIPLPLLAGGR